MLATHNRNKKGTPIDKILLSRRSNNLESELYFCLYPRVNQWRRAMQHSHFSLKMRTRNSENPTTALTEEDTTEQSESNSTANQKPSSFVFVLIPEKPTKFILNQEKQIQKINLT